MTAVVAGNVGLRDRLPGRPPSVTGEPLPGPLMWPRGDKAAQYTPVSQLEDDGSDMTRLDVSTDWLLTHRRCSSSGVLTASRRPGATSVAPNGTVILHLLSRGTVTNQWDNTIIPITRSTLRDCCAGSSAACELVSLTDSSYS